MGTEYENNFTPAPSYGGTYPGASSVASGHPVSQPPSTGQTSYASYPPVEQQRYADAPPGHAQQPTYNQAPPGYYPQPMPPNAVIMVTTGIPGCRTLPARVPPQPGMVIIGWESKQYSVSSRQITTVESLCPAI